jgi:hypothetical protein
MKTKTLFLTCLFLGIGLIRLSAQTGQKTEKIEGKFEYWQPVYCEGMEDYLTGSTIFSGIQHYNKDGIVIWQNFHNRGTAVSEKTGELFNVEETDKQNPDIIYVNWSFNLKGDQGSHYLGSMTFDWASGEITVNKFVCVVNGKK